MFSNDLSLWLNMLTIAVLTFALANGAVSVVVASLAQQFLTIQVRSRKTVLWMLAILPWFASLCVTLCFIYKFYTTSPFDKSFDFAHWHHMASFNWQSWHGITLMIAAIIFTYVISSKLWQLRKHSKELALLTDLSQPIADNVYKIEAPYASAFTSGFTHKRCFVTDNLLAQTSQREQAIIIAHEQAHAKHSDPLKKWLFSILAAFFIPTIGKRLKLHMTLAMEQDADNAVISDKLDSTAVASTLVKVARLNAQQTPVCHNELVANFGAQVLEQRVYFLLGQLNLKPANKYITTMLMAATLLLCLGSIDVLHHFIETVFSH